MISSKFRDPCDGLIPAAGTYRFLTKNKRIWAVRATAVVLIVFVFVSAVLFVQVAQGSSSTCNPMIPRHIIMIVGDGMGVNQQLAADYLAKKYKPYYQGLKMRTFPVQTRVSTRSLSGITDTQAAFTALLTGYKTKNGRFARDKEGKPLTTVFEVAWRRGMSTGMVSSACIDGQSLALAGSTGGNDFVQKVIPALLTNQANVVILACADSTLATPISRLAETVGYTIKGPDDNWLDDYQSAGSNKMPFMGLVKRTNTYYDLDQPEPQQKMLAKSTRMALDLLDKNPNGFFLLVHGAQIDRAAHRKDLAAQLRETVALDEAVQEAYAYYLKHPDDTLIIVTGDHETGGMILQSGWESKIKNSMAWLGMSREALLNEYMKSGLEKGIPVTEYLINKGISLERGEAAALQNYVQIKDFTGLENRLTVLIASKCGVYYKTNQHTDAPVPLAVLGRWANYLAKCRSNSEVGQALLGIMNSTCKERKGKVAGSTVKSKS